MELDELKASWNILNNRLAENEVVNMRLVKEIITQKTKSAFDRIYGLNMYNLVVTLLIICVVFPYVYLSTPISTISFVIVEAAMVIGLIPMIRKLLLLSKFDVEEKKCNELNGLVLKYKKVCNSDYIWSISIVGTAMIAFYILELGFNKDAGYVLGTRILLPLALSLLTFGMAYFIALWQRRQHAQKLAEIERGLEELKEFEN